MDSNLKKFIGILVIVLIIILLFVFRLVNLQLVQGSSYLTQSQNKVLRNTVIQAPRGEICDRLGRPLVINRKGYSVYIERDMINTNDLNDVLLNLVKTFKVTGDKFTDSFPISFPPFTYLVTDSEDTELKDFNKFLTKKKIAVSSDAETIINKLSAGYNLEKYSPEDRRSIIGLRFELEYKNTGSSYEFASDVNMNTISVLRERYQDFPGISVEVVPVREYVETGLASNILGYVGSIFSEEYAQLKEKGYELDDKVGKDGIEKTCEGYLRGKDGIKQVEKNTDGQITSVIDTVNPEPGNNVILTIDEDLQRVAEDSLKTRIAEIKAYTSANHLEGSDAQGGAAVAVDVNTGEILALASYPTFDLSAYNSNFSQLINDPMKPLLNRAIGGTYPPGSSFKMVAATAALDEKVISTTWTYTCTGKYTYFSDYQPTCYHGAVHGTNNIVGAIRYSCNSFFFDVGRMVGIDNLNKYAKMYGFGQLTGIEIPGEVKGILAGREEREKQGKTWNPGDTIQASIGQSDNMLTPIQLAGYVQTIATGGTRYKLHIIKSIKNYHYGKTIVDNTPVIADTVPMSDEVKNAIRTGMKRVVKEGAVSSKFAGFSIEVAGKTGTAQVPNGSSNGVFVCYAPADKPQIAIAVVVEHGSEGYYLGSIARDILEKYFASKQMDDAIIQEGTLLN